MHETIATSVVVIMLVWVLVTIVVPLVESVNLALDTGLRLLLSLLSHLDMGQASLFIFVNNLLHPLLNDPLLISLRPSSTLVSQFIFGFRFNIDLSLGISDHAESVSFIELLPLEPLFHR